MLQYVGYWMLYFCCLYCSNYKWQSSHSQLHFKQEYAKCLHSVSVMICIVCINWQQELCMLTATIQSTIFEGQRSVKQTHTEARNLQLLLQICHSWRRGEHGAVCLMMQPSKYLTQDLHYIKIGRTYHFIYCFSDLSVIISVCNLEARTHSHGRGSCALFLTICRLGACRCEADGHILWHPWYGRKSN